MAFTSTQPTSTPISHGTYIRERWSMRISYVLYYGSRTFTVIPKRVFQNTEQQAAFDQLLTQHVPVIVRKK